LTDSGPVTAEIAVPAKQRYRLFVARHEVAWELLFAALAVLFVALAFAPVTPSR
jgi:hypothetical protein